MKPIEGVCRRIYSTILNKLANPKIAYSVILHLTEHFQNLAHQIHNQTINIITKYLEQFYEQLPDNADALIDLIHQKGFSTEGINNSEEQVSIILTSIFTPNLLNIDDRNILRSLPASTINHFKDYITLPIIKEIQYFIGNALIIGDSQLDNLLYQVDSLDTTYANLLAMDIA
ncbi:MAG: hypothetical protein WBJ81_05375 [Rickettsiales bacterium]